MVERVAPSYLVKAQNPSYQRKVTLGAWLVFVAATFVGLFGIGAYFNSRYAIDRAESIRPSAIEAIATQRATQKAREEVLRSIAPSIKENHEKIGVALDKISKTRTSVQTLEKRDLEHAKDRKVLQKLLERK